jgi:hypothetical protein
MIRNMSRTADDTLAYRRAGVPMTAYNLRYSQNTGPRD